MKKIHVRSSSKATGCQGEVREESGMLSGRPAFPGNNWIYEAVAFKKIYSWRNRFVRQKNLLEM